MFQPGSADEGNDDNISDDGSAISMLASLSLTHLPSLMAYLLKAPNIQNVLAPSISPTMVLGPHSAAEDTSPKRSKRT